MAITIYELLGLIKDGKAPKKIKYNGDIYTLKNRIDDAYNYYSENNDAYLCEIYLLENILNDTVEIIEEEKKIEKLNLNYKGILHKDNIKFKEEILMYCDNLQSKINDLIDEINRLKGAK